MVLWTIKAVLHRLEPASVVERSIEENPGLNTSKRQGTALNLIDRFNDRKASIQAYSDSITQQWLPGFGEPLTVKHMIGACLLVPLVAGFRGSMEFLSKYGISWVGERVVNDLRIKVFNTLSGLSLDYFNRAKMGDMLTRINGDTTMLQTCLSSGVRNSITCPMTILSVFLVYSKTLPGSLRAMLQICVRTTLFEQWKHRRSWARSLRDQVRLSRRFSRC